jgi:multidrug efflux pump subunit AcrB
MYIRPSRPVMFCSITCVTLFCSVVAFKNGTDPDIAQVQVQNKLQVATPLLPQEVQQQGLVEDMYIRPSRPVMFCSITCVTLFCSVVASAPGYPDIAQVQVQNKLQVATPLLPQEVQQQGITVMKSYWDPARCALRTANQTASCRPRRQYG